MFTAMNAPPGTPGGVRVYWRPGCPYCAMLRLGLRTAGVPAEWVNIWENPAAAGAVRAITGGDEIVPTVLVGARAMVNPSARQVVAAVREARPAARPPSRNGAASWFAGLARLVNRGRP